MANAEEHMRVAGIYSFKNGREVVEQKYPHLLAEIYEAIQSIDEEQHKSKESKEVTMAGQMLYSPSSLNKAFKADFKRIGGWSPVRVKAEYSVDYYHDGYTSAPMNKGAFREMDFVKDGLGVEVQFGKYAFMVYNVCAKMTIFQKLGHISASGIRPRPGQKSPSLPLALPHTKFVGQDSWRGLSKPHTPCGDGHGGCLVFGQGAVLPYPAFTAFQTAGVPPAAKSWAAEGDGLRRIGAPHWTCG